MNRQLLAGGLIGLGVLAAILVGVTLGLGIPIGSLGGKSSNALFQSRNVKASSNQTTAQQPSNAPASPQSSPNTQAPSNTSNNSSAVPALW